MPSFANRLSESSNLLKALEAATNWRAIAMEAAGFVAFMIIIGLGVASGSGFVGFIMTLIAIVALVIGFSATGYLLMDQAKGQPVRSFMDALLASIFSLHRLIGVLAVEIVLFIVVLLAIAVLLLICKIPWLGPILYTFIFPLTALVAGFALLALFYVGLSMLAPAVWDGNGIMASIARLLTIVRQRLLTVVFNLILLYLIVLLVSIVTFGVAIAGSLSTAGLSASIIGFGGGAGFGAGFGGDYGAGFGGPFAGLLSTFRSAGGVSGYGLALLIGSGLLYFAAALIPSVVSISGINRIYLDVSAGLDFKATEETLSKHMDDAKRRAQSLQSRTGGGESKPEDQ